MDDLESQEEDTPKCILSSRRELRYRDSRKLSRKDYGRRYSSNRDILLYHQGYKRYGTN